MNFLAQVECLNLASITASVHSRRLGFVWLNRGTLPGGRVRSANSALFADARVRSASACDPACHHPFLDADFVRRVKAAITSRATGFCSLFVLARTSMSRKQNLYSPRVRSQ